MNLKNHFDDDSFSLFRGPLRTQEHNSDVTAAWVKRQNTTRVSLIVRCQQGHDTRLSHKLARISKTTFLGNFFFRLVNNRIKRRQLGEISDEILIECRNDDDQKWKKIWRKQISAQYGDAEKSQSLEFQGYEVDHPSSVIRRPSVYIHTHAEAS